MFLLEKRSKKDSEMTRRTERAVMRYKDTVYGIAVTQLRSRQDADDAFQEVFMTYLTKAPEFSSDEHEKAWLIRTAVNICRRYRRGCRSKRWAVIRMRFSSKRRSSSG